ncbi:MAG: sulfatase [Mariniblastus sp.]|nr:sulfatase [Mariniblastus sp.]
MGMVLELIEERIFKGKTNMKLILTLFLISLSGIGMAQERDQPNLIVIFCDDLGYGDLGCYGSKKNRTPNVDQLARTGIRFTDFYSSSPVCTPSRSSLMTGCYARRVGMHEDYTGHWVLIPRSRRGLNPEELTVAEALQSVGYATACIGKWHLGDQPEHLPTEHGFDFYFGIPYSNDMQSKGRGDPPLPLVKQSSVVEAPVDQSTLTKRYTETAIEFITANQSKPFFVYLPHTFPHLPLHASPDFLGKSANGRYGDSVEEIDWSTGQILASLDRLGIADNTLVIFTSDNGSNGRNGGSNQPFSGNKGSTMEGGMRVPMIAKWPGRIKPGTICGELATTMDILPTFCELAGAKLSDRKIDGFDISGLLFGHEGAESAYESLYYYRRRQLQAIRMGDWKYHLPLKAIHPNWTTHKTEGAARPAKLVNLKSDPRELKDVSAANPQVLAKMQALGREAIAKLGNDANEGVEQRSALTLDSSAPMVLNK